MTPTTSQESLLGGVVSWLDRKLRSWSVSGIEGDVVVGETRIVPSTWDQLRALDAADVELTDPGLVRLIAPADAALFALSFVPSESETAKALLLGAEQSAKVYRDGFLRRLALYTRDFNEVDEAITFPEVKVPIGEVHSPHRPGCEAQLEQVKERTRALSFDVRVVVVRSRAGGRRTVTSVNSLRMKQGCRWLWVPMKARVQAWKQRDTNEIVHVVNILEIAEHWQESPFSEEPKDACGLDYESAVKRLRAQAMREPKDFHRYLMRHPGAEGQAERGAKEVLERGREFEIEVGPEFKVRDVTIGLVLKVTSKLLTRVTIEYKLVEGADYVGYYLPRDSHTYVWAWTS